MIDFENPHLEEMSMIRTIPMTIYSHIVNIDDDIGEPSKYRGVVQLLATATENDSITFLINSPGGRLDSMLMIIEAIGSCEAEVSAVVLGSAYSAASMLACAVPNCQISDAAEFMIHTASYGTGGTTPNVRGHTEFVNRQVDKLIDKIYAGFLSPQEIKDVKSGKELWLDADESRERMGRLYEHRAREAKRKPKPRRAA